MSDRTDSEVAPVQVLGIGSSEVNKPLKKCILGEEEMLCTVDLGNDCSLVRESIARRLKLVFKRMDTTLSGFNHFLVVPLAHSKINVRIDDIPLRVRVLIVPNELSKEVIIGRDISIKPGIQAISDATGVTFTLNRLNQRDNKLEVNVVNVDERKAIEINDIHCGELEEKDRTRLTNSSTTTETAFP